MKESEIQEQKLAEKDMPKEGQKLRLGVGKALKKKEKDGQLSLGEVIGQPLAFQRQPVKKSFR